MVNSEHVKNLAKKGTFSTVPQKWTFLDSFLHAQNLACAEPQYGLQDLFSRLKMKMYLVHAHRTLN